jgi:penicillin V acylase-like amidase (Ntn superfamily)
MEYYGPYQQTDFSDVLDDQYSSISATIRTQSDWACSLFAALGNENNHIFGRNFDWEYSPGLLLFTDPPDGYASVSMVDIAYLGFDEKNAGRLSELTLTELTPLLDAPNWPFDGMNERGLVIGMAAVPPSPMLSDPQKPSIGSLQIMRQVLDQAGDLEEAQTILENFNIEFSGGPVLHYLIADTSGEAVLVEFFQGEMHIIPNDNPWHQATNFIISAYEDPQGQCRRYDKISDMMQTTGGNINTQSAADLLSEVSQNNTQWSVLYHIQSGDIELIMGRQFDRIHKFQLKP